MRKFKIAAMAAVLMLTVFLASGCTTYNNFKDTFFGGKGETSDTIKIGVLEPQTGNDSSNGELELQGIELAHQLVPQVLDKPIELVYADTQSSIYVAETAAEDLAARNPAVILGSYGEAVTLTASQIFAREGIPSIAITATNPLITANNDYYFRVAFSDASQGRALADYAFEGLGQAQAGIVRMKDDDTTNEMVNQFSSRLRRLSGDEECITLTVEIPENTKDHSDYAREIAESDVQTVFLPVSISNGEKLLDAVGAAGIQGITFLVPKDWHNDDLIRLQNKYPGIKIAVASDFVSGASDAAGISEQPQSQIYQQFLAAYEKEYGGGEPPEEVALAFDAYMIAVEAIERAGSVERTAVREALLATNGFEGASGEISFNESGEPTKTINIDVVQDGKFVSVFTVK